MIEELSNRVQQFESVDALADFVLGVRYEDLHPEVVDAAKIFIMDSIAVGVAGTTYDATDKALAAAAGWGLGDTRVVGRPDTQLARPSAAFVNGMQVHALEWDGLHEPSVVIALCAPIGAMLAELDGKTCSGTDLIVAMVVAVEVAVFFGGNASAGPRFFRPSCAGGMGAAAGLAHLRGFDKTQLIHTLGLAHAQTAGTMQAHWEGSMALPMQVGNAARMAHLAADMVAAGMTGPIDFVAGRFGYFKLFEAGEGVDELLRVLGKPYKITEMAHKPYPAGRATQATLTMIRQLRQEHDFAVADIACLRVFVPPLIMFLVGRPASDDMTPSYARLCLRFVAPLMLLDAEIDPRRYTPDAFADAELRALGDRIEICGDGNPDENALGPQRCELVLKSGQVLEASCADPLGSPGFPLTREQREDKVRRCFELGLPGANAESFIESCASLEALEDAGSLLGMVS